MNQNIQNSQNTGSNIDNPFANANNQNSDNENDSENDQEDDDFYLIFNVNDEKQMYLNTEPTSPFSQILSGLKEKFQWLEGMNVKGFKYNNSLIPLSSNPITIGIQKGSKIDVVL